MKQSKNPERGMRLIVATEVKLFEYSMRTFRVTIFGLNLSWKLETMIYQMYLTISFVAFKNANHGL